MSLRYPFCVTTTAIASRTISIASPSAMGLERIVNIVDNYEWRLVLRHVGRELVLIWHMPGMPEDGCSTLTRRGPGRPLGPHLRGCQQIRDRA